MFSIETILDLFYEHLFSFGILFVFISLFRHLLSSYVSRRRLPAGPTGLPFIGYQYFLGDSPHREIAKLSDKYGNVFTLPLGVLNVVILNDFNAVKDAFSKDALLGRPYAGPFSQITKAITLSEDNDQVWRDHRRFSLQLLRDLGFGKGSMEDRIIEEIVYLFEAIDRTKNEPANIHEILTLSMSNNVSQLVFGHRFEMNDPKRVLLDQVLDQGSKLCSATGILATGPTWLAKLAYNINMIIHWKLNKSFMNIFESEISNHVKNFNESDTKRDYIDGFLTEMQTKKKKDPNTTFTLDKLTANSFAFFSAGSDTVRTTTEWCLLTATHYLDHQKRVQAEIDEVVGTHRTVSWADRLRMPFTQAFICEVLRWKTTLPLNLYRRAVEDTQILNHFIPKDTLVLANLWAVHNDPKLWDKPDQFNPHRFLTDDAKELTNTDFLVPFSIGKRSCAGETMARVEVFLYFASLLQRYIISAPKGQTISFEELYGLSLQPKVNPMLVFKKRINID